MTMVRAPYQVGVLPFRQIDGAERQYALFFRSDAGYWQVIAGGGEDTETPLEAARREAVEEAGIPPAAQFYRLDTTGSVPVFNFKAAAQWPRDLYVIPMHYFAVDATGQTIVLSHEHTDFNWFSFDEAVEQPRWDTDKIALWELHTRLDRQHMVSA